MLHLLQISVLSYGNLSESTLHSVKILVKTLIPILSSLHVLIISSSCEGVSEYVAIL